MTQSYFITCFIKKHTMQPYISCLNVIDFLHAIYFRGMQILANEWADPNSASVKGTGCYKTVSYSSKQKGDIVAFKRNGSSGHVGIMSTNGNFISALRYKVDSLDVDGFRSGDSFIVSTTVWRYTC